jgi:phage protein D
VAAAKIKSAFLQLWLDGKKMDDALGRVLRLEVDERSEEASSFHLSLDMAPTDDADWDMLADERFRLLHRLTIALGVGQPDAEAPDDSAVVFDGYITAVEPSFGPARVPDSSLELYGLDTSCLMHLEEKTRAFSNLSDSEIVKQIYGEYGFGLDVQDTKFVRDAERGQILQRGTDAELVRLLARRNGFEAYVERAPVPVTEGSNPGSQIVGHFHLPRTEAVPQPAMTLMPASSPSLIELKARWESHRATEIHAAHIDERSRRIRSVAVSAPRFARMGKTSRADILAARLPAILPKQTSLKGVGLQYADVPHDAAEVENLAWSDYLQADWLAEASGTVQGLRYPAVLRARRPVGLTGAGKVMDGTWYVRGARHRWVWDNEIVKYEIDVDLCRNALNQVA